MLGACHLWCRLQRALMACGRQWVPPGVCLLVAFCCGGVWPAAGGECAAHIEGWWKSRRWYGAAPRWCGWLDVWAGSLGGCLRRGRWGVTSSGSVQRVARRIATQWLFCLDESKRLSDSSPRRPPARSARCPLRSPTRCHSVHETAAQPQRTFSQHHGQHTASGPPQATPPQAQDTEGGTTGPGRSPPRNTSASAAATRSRGRSPQGEHNEHRHEPRGGRREGNGPPQATS